MMSFTRLVALSCLLFGSALSKPAPRASAQASTTVSSAQTLPTTCGDIIQQADFEDVYSFSASQVYECLTSVPFNDAVALRFIDYYNDTMQFHSTLAYLKDPPEGYQQPPVDLLDGLAVIKQNISAGYYKNQYAFEAEVQKLVYSVHDMHVDLSSGILSAFAFGSDSWEIVSVSKDGKELPQIYLTGDILYTEDPQPITAINGEDPVEFLTKLAALNAVGTLEPHADWNQLMSSPAIDIQGIYSVFSQGLTFYPGDKLTFTWADDTKVDTDWLAFYMNAAHTGPLSTGGDFYNYFVLGLLPDSYNESVYPVFEDDSDGTSEGTLTNWYNASFKAYPSNPDVYQDGLAPGGGVVTGYLLNETSTGVLSIPSFDMYGDYIYNFSTAVVDFVDKARDANMSRIIIDLQQNLGGQSLLAYDTYRRFFPQADPYRGSRRRDHEMANTLGRVTTGFWDSLEPGTDDYDNYYQLLASDEWVVTDRLNADTGANFTSWAEYYGPRTYHGDSFSLNERYNLTSDVFVESAFDGYSFGFPGLGQTWAAEDILLLTDGLCSSSCAEFVEWMTQRGVRTIVAGGRPSAGPMQAASGTRGARLYSADLIDADIDWVLSVDNSTAGSLPATRDPGMQTSYAGLNLRDQVREGDAAGVPLQFMYQAAHCRIYYTIHNVYNMTRLWLDAAAAAWDDDSLCVDGSTGYASFLNTTAAKDPPARLADEPVQLNVLDTSLDYNSDANAAESGLEAATSSAKGGATVCKTKTGGCGANQKAVPAMKVQCGQTITECVCMPVCRTDLDCGGALKCRDKTSTPDKSLGTQTTSKLANNVKGSSSSGSGKGVCKPDTKLQGTKYLSLCAGQAKSG
ncbi:Peptidase S41 [Macrophomina phaseolina MS6]|uniref:Peptidase S41 n=1 Tax=Macrophomina phaseolina (strain MS6) TaxID=1126212 RepID=K2S0S1_MACPH|nr:Peptidase S41 [Macrophomina phaseolina MS6]